MQYDEYTEGWTAPIEHTLEHDGATFNASGITPSLTLKDKDGNAITFTGTVTWADSSVSRIRYSPAAGDLVASKSPYKLHWKVTDGSGKIAFYPQGAPIMLTVYPQ
jgi:hypothetical protein